MPGYDDNYANRATAFQDDTDDVVGDHVQSLYEELGADPGGTGNTAGKVSGRIAATETDIAALQSETAQIPVIEAELAVINARLDLVAAYDTRITDLEARVAVLEGTPNPPVADDLQVLTDLNHINAVAAYILAGTQPWANAWTRFNTRTVAGGASGTSYTANAAIAVIDAYTAETAPAQANFNAAYQHALRWAIVNTVDSANTTLIGNLRSKIIAIFDDYVTTDTQWVNTGNVKLGLGWTAILAIRAAALLDALDDGTNWTSTDRAAVKDWMWRRFFEQTISPATNQLMNHTSQSNWLAVFAEARISGGIYLGRDDLYQAGLTYWRAIMPTTIFKTGDTTGNPAQFAGYGNSWVYNSEYNTAQEQARGWFFGDVIGTPSSGAVFFDGLQQELGRDLGHSQMSNGAMLQAACTAFNAGNDLFEDTTTDAGYRLRAAIEIGAGYYDEVITESWANHSGGHSTGDLPAGMASFTPSGGKAKNDIPDWSDSNIGTWSGDTTQVGSIQTSQLDIGGSSADYGWEPALYHYVGRLGYWLPNLEALAPKLRSNDGTSTRSSTSNAGVASITEANHMVAHPLLFAAGPNGTGTFNIPTTQVSDDFSTNAASGLGTADTGGAWETRVANTGSTSGFSVSGGQGLVVISNGNSRSADLPVSVTDVSIWMGFELSALPSAGGTWRVSLNARRDQATGACYRYSTQVDSTGQLSHRIYRTTDNSSGSTPLASVSGFAGVTTTQLWMRFDVRGSTLRGKAWLGKQYQEPTAWAITATDTNITSGGEIGFHTEPLGTFSFNRTLEINRIFAR